jgi:hypothetical protein
MAYSKDRGAAGETTRVATDRARKANDRAMDTGREVAAAMPEPVQHAVDKWTREVQEGLARYQEMLSQLPGFAVNGAEVGETRSVASGQLIEFNTELLSYAQVALNDSFEVSKAVINAGSMQEAMQIHISHARNAMQRAGEQAMKLADRSAKLSRATANPKGPDESRKQARAPRAEV